MTLPRDERWGDRLLCDVVLEALQAAACPGASVLTGRGEAQSSQSHYPACGHEVKDTEPLIIEWVDEPNHVASVMKQMDGLVSDSCIAVDQVELVYGSRRELCQAADAAKVRDWMSSQVKAVTPDLPVAVARGLFHRDGVRALPVVDAQRRVIGLLTESDLLAAPSFIESDPLRGAHARSLRDSLSRVGDLMTRAPVWGQLVGIISQVDLLWPAPHTSTRKAPDRHFGFVMS
jgi:CBS domain-containing protein